MLAIETFPLGDMAMVRAPASGAVAVVGARARAILDGLRAGRTEDEIARAEAGATGCSHAVALGEVAALRAAWAALSRPAPAPPPLPRPASAAKPPALDVVAGAGPTPVRLRVWPVGLAAMLRAVTLPSHLAAPGHGGHMPTIEVHRRGRTYVVELDGERVLATDQVMIARSETLRRLVLAAHPERHWLAVLHGAGVAGPRGAALLCGASGSGKSTLTGLLLAGGLELVTDDYAPIEAGTGLLWPVAFGLSVKAGSWPLLAPHFPRLATAPLVRTRARSQRYLADLPRSARPQPVCCLVFPLYQPGAGFELTRLTPGETLELSARSGGWYESSPERLAEFVAWIGAIPAYAMSYGDAEPALAAVRKLLG